MTDILIESTSEEGMVTTSIVGDFELTVDATGEEGPATIPTLVATYASCFVPALRVGGEQRGVEDMGRIEIDTEADTDDDDKLEAVHFKVKTEAEIENSDEVVERAKELCKVEAALRDDLRAEVTVEDDAF